jgi:hypothetical protein
VDPSSPSIDRKTAQWRLQTGRLTADETVVLPVLTGSMAPLLPVGAEIEVRGVADPAELAVGDVVVFRRGDQLVAHRLLMVWGLGPGRWFLERGDGVSGPGRVRARDVLGRVVAVRGDHARRDDLTTPEAQRRSRRSVRLSLRRLITDLWRKRRP